MKKKRVNLPPREAPYETYALADKKRETPWGTTMPWTVCGTGARKISSKKGILADPFLFTEPRGC